MKESEESEAKLGIINPETRASRQSQLPPSLSQALIARLGEVIDDAGTRLSDGVPARREYEIERVVHTDGRFFKEKTTLMRLLLVLGAASLGFAGASDAELVTESPGGTTLIDFSQFDRDFRLTPGPEQIGDLVGEDVVWSSDFPAAVIGNGSYGLAFNGRWTSARTGYVGLNNAIGSMRFDFNDGPVSFVGALINYASPPTEAVLMEALGIADVVLESYAITSDAPIDTPPDSMDEGEFRGIRRDAADIVALRVSNELIVVDDVEFYRDVDGTSPGATVQGINARRAGCVNVTHPQAAFAPLPGIALVESWDCEALGLTFTPGDTVRLTVAGTGSTSVFSGRVDSLHSGEAHCRNLTQAASITTPLTEAGEWTCTGAGLPVARGDVVKGIVTGTAQ